MTCDRGRLLPPLRYVSMINLYRLDRIKNLHSLDSIDTESLSARGRSVWVHSSQVRLLDTSVPHSSMPEAVGLL